MPAYCSPASRFIASHHQPALVFEHARSADVAATRLLDGCGLDADEMAETATRLSPRQFLRLVHNTSRALATPDTSFLLGQQMLPGHFGAVSHALIHAANLREALTILTRHQPRLSPLLMPRLMSEGPVAVLYWTDTFSAPALRPLLVEMHMTAVVGMTRWLSGERLPWRFCFNRARPRHSEQHVVHLGAELRFGCQFDAQLIDAGWLDRPWPRGNRPAMLAALRIAEAELDAEPSCRGLLQLLYDYLMANLGNGPSLEHAALDFGVSPATLKRHLAFQGTHFQAELDLVRTHASIYLLQVRGCDNDEVARCLGFHDAKNFRRSFRRWTGLTPHLLRGPLSPAT